MGEHRRNADVLGRRTPFSVALRGMLQFKKRNSSMNLLVFSQYFWPENFRINDLVQSLKKHVSVEVLTGQPNYPQGSVFAGYRAWGCQTEQWRGVALHRVPLAARGRGGALRLAANYLSFILSAALVAPFKLRGRPVDIVFVYAPSPLLQAIPAILISCIKGAKLAIWVQDLWPESLEATGFVRNRSVLAMLRCVVRWIYRRADLILVQSEAFMAPVAALADAGKIRYYPNSADEVFTGAHADADCVIAGLEEGFSVVFAGNLGTAQAVETIIDAAALLSGYPEIRLVLVGSGSRVAWLQREIESRKLCNVQLAGQHPLTAMPAILRRAGALLVTLKDEAIFYHTVPSKVQAYLATGRPIIACLNGEGARIIEQAGAGMTCPAEDAAALAATIARLYLLPAAERSQLGKNGLRYFESHFNGEHLTRTLIAHFEKLLASNIE